MRTIIMVAVLVGLVLLQIFLSKSENKVVGLIIPILSFFATLIIPLNMIRPDGYTAIFIVQLVFIFLIANIPTLIFLAIYFACKRKSRRNKGLDKMNIQDLD